MKNNNWTLIYNPFTRIAGWQALWIGLCFALLTTILGTYSNVAFDGAIDAHFVEQINLRTSLIFLGINILSATLAMYGIAVIIAKNVRFIDIFGTTTFARIPYLLFSLTGFLITPTSPQTFVEDPTTIFAQPGFLFGIIISLPIIIWFISLMFNAFKVSTGAKGTKLIVGFIIGLVLSEIISKILIYLLIIKAE